jgi:hypothetical protein
MSRLVAIDPGGARKKCAVVHLTDQEINGYAFECLSRERGSLLAFCGLIATVLVERPQQDARSRYARPEDLIEIAWEGALLAAAYAHARGARLVELEPREWKGTEPKSQMHFRLWSVLSDAERFVLGGGVTYQAILSAREKSALKRHAPHSTAYYPRSFVMADVLDAAALAAVYLGRIEKRG